MYRGLLTSQNSVDLGLKLISAARFPTSLGSRKRSLMFSLKVSKATMTSNRGSRSPQRSQGVRLSRILKSLSSTAYASLSQRYSSRNSSISLLVARSWSLAICCRWGLTTPPFVHHIRKSTIELESLSSKTYNQCTTVMACTLRQSSGVCRHAIVVYYLRHKGVVHIHSQPEPSSIFLVGVDVEDEIVRSVALLVGLHDFLIFILTFEDTTAPFAICGC